MGISWLLAMLLLADAPPTFPATIGDEGTVQLKFEALDDSVHVAVQDGEVVVDRTDAAAPPTRLIATIDASSFAGATVVVTVHRRFEFEAHSDYERVFEPMLGARRLGDRPLEFGGAAVTVMSGIEHWIGQVPRAANQLRLGIALSGHGRFTMLDFSLHRCCGGMSVPASDSPRPLSADEDRALRERLDTSLIPLEGPGGEIAAGYILGLRPSAIFSSDAVRNRNRWLLAVQDIRELANPDDVSSPAPELEFREGDRTSHLAIAWLALSGAGARPPAYSRVFAAAAEARDLRQLADLLLAEFAADARLGTLTTPYGTATAPTKFAETFAPRLDVLGLRVNVLRAKDLEVLKPQLIAAPKLLIDLRGSSGPADGYPALRSILAKRTGPAVPLLMDRTTCPEATFVLFEEGMSIGLAARDSYRTFTVALPFGWTVTPPPRPQGDLIQPRIRVSPSASPQGDAILERALQYLDSGK